MDQKQLLFLRRTLHLAQMGFQKSSISPAVGWVAVQHDHIVAEGWLEPERSVQTQLEASFSAISFQPDTLLYLNAYPLGGQHEFTRITHRFNIRTIIVGEEQYPSLSRSPENVNRRLWVYHRKKRPYLLLKWAQTADGFLARTNYDSKWISGTHARKLVHRWRAQETAIWVGKNTYYYDNPRLNVRNWTGENPVRIVIDPQRSLSSELHVFDQGQPTLYYTETPIPNQPNLEFIALPPEKEWKARVTYVLSDLYRRQITSVLVEGGGQLLSFLIEEQWWDEARVFTAEKTFGEGIAAPTINDYYLVGQEPVSQDQLKIYYRYSSEAEKKIEK